MNEVIRMLKKRVFQANLALPKEQLVKLTWGNASAINRELGIVVIKPSGVPYSKMTEEQMVVTDLQGEILEKASLKPSSDLPTHLVLYQEFKEIGGIVHTHSKNAVKWAQAARDIPVYGTTHGDTFYGDIPCTRQLTKAEVNAEYEKETGNLIVATIQERALNPMAIPGIITQGHGPFTWASSVEKAVENSIVLDEIAEMAMGTEQINPQAARLTQYLLDKHYYRKHGEQAYYGQK